MVSPEPCAVQIEEFEVLLRAHHPLVWVDSLESDRVDALLRAVAENLSLPYFRWDAHGGLKRDGMEQAVYSTEKPGAALAHALKSGESLYYLTDVGDFLESPPLRAQFRQVHDQLYEHRGAVVLSGSEIPESLQPLFTHVRLAPPSLEAYRKFVVQTLRDLQMRMTFSVNLEGKEVTELLQHLRGLSMREVRRIITRAVTEDGALDIGDLVHVLDAKKDVIRRSGVLEYYASEESIVDVAGMPQLKKWLSHRKSAFTEPERAKSFGLVAPKGLLLLGVQGCGKSLCAKAVASAWHLPLVRLDPGALYNKYMGETERNFRKAMSTAEAMAPIVLWIDEVEKAFASEGSSDAGTSKRILGTFLTWLNDKKDPVFVIATANDISALPPELLRKGRFDEIFFVDLPDASAREDIFAVHLRRRGRDPRRFDLPRLAQATEGFSGAEIEQVVVSALYACFAANEELSMTPLLDETEATRPLSVMMGEKIVALRAWAIDKAVRA